MISCSKCKKATLPVSDGGCIRTGGIVDIGCEYGEPRVLTNYDRIISKSPEELAEWIAEILFYCSNTICDKKCPMYKCCCDQPSDNIEDWLKQEAKE